MSKNEILKKMDLFLQVNDSDYYGRIKDDGFFIGKRNWKVYLGGSSKNAFAPVAIGKITAENGVTTLTVVMRMNILVQILFLSIYLPMLLTIIFIPFLSILLYFAFLKPAKRLKNEIQAEFSYDERKY